MTYLIIDGEALPRPDSYSVDFTDVEADSGGTTEAGTTQRDVVRHGVVSISASFQLTASWLSKMSEMSETSVLTVQYLDPKQAAMTTTRMWMDGFKSDLVKDSPQGGIWKASFTLKEY